MPNPFSTSTLGTKTGARAYNGRKSKMTERAPELMNPSLSLASDVVLADATLAKLATVSINTSTNKVTVTPKDPDFVFIPSLLIDLAGLEGVGTTKTLDTVLGAGLDAAAASIPAVLTVSSAAPTTVSLEIDLTTWPTCVVYFRVARRAARLAYPA